MTRRTMAERRRRAAERDTRRDSLLVLLSRAQRGVPITPTEAALLRAHVEAELAEADELRRTVAGQQNAMQRAIERTRAAEAAIVEAEEDARLAQAQTDREHALARTWAGHVRQQLARIKAAERTLARVRNAETLAEAMAAVAEHDGLTPEAAQIHAAITARADSPALVLAERDRDHAIALATVERRAQDAAQRAIEEEATSLRYANYLAAAQRACGAPNWPALAATVKALADRARAEEQLAPTVGTP